MPDVFDQIAPMPAPAAAAPAQPKGDVFDQIAAPQPDHAAGNYLRSHPGMDPYAVQQAFRAMQGKGPVQQPVTPGEFSQQVANQQGGFTHFGNALGQTIANPIQGAVGLVSPQTGMQLRQENALQYGPQTGAGGFVGAQVGNLVNSPYVMTPAGRILSAAEAMGNKRIDIAEERAAGQNVGGASEVARVAGTGALDLGVNTLTNKIGGNLFGGIGQGPAAATTKQIIQNFAKKFGIDAVTNEVVAHAQIAAQNLIDGRPITEGMGKESAVAPLVQTAAFGLAHGGASLAERIQSKNLGGKNAVVSENKPAPVEAQPSIHPAGEAAGPSRVAAGESETPSGETRIPQRPKGGQSDTETPVVLTKGETQGDRSAYESFDRGITNRIASGELKSEADMTPGEKQALDAMERAGQRPRPTEPLRLAQTEESPASKEHPARLESADELVDWYKKQNPNDQTGDLIKSMAPHVPYVEARVPVDQVKPLSGGEDITRSKVEAMKGMTAEQRHDLGPAILGPDGEVFDGNHRAIAAKEAGDTHLRAYVPEGMIGKNGIEAASEAPVEHTEESLLDRHQQVEALKAANDPRADSWAAKLQSDLMDFGDKHGEDAMENVIEKMQPKAKLLARRPTDRPGFVAIPESKFVERDVKPAAESALSKVKQSWGKINRFLGTGASWTTKDRDTANQISAALAEHKRDLAQIEHTLKPSREAMESWSDKAKAQWVDTVEATGRSPDPAHQAVADYNHQLNEENIKEGKLVGLHTNKWEGDWLGRMAEFPDDKAGGSGKGGGLAGTQHFLKGRVFDTFSDFKKFVEANGGKLKYSNPMDMLLAKQGEVRKSIVARQALYNEENHAQLAWVPEGTKPPEGFEHEVTDPAATQERRQILPSQMVGRLSKMDHFAAQSFLQSPAVKASEHYLRPGTDLPKGWAYSGESERGTYHGNANVTDQINNLISRGINKEVPVLHMAAQAAHAASSFKLAVSPVHYVIEAGRNLSLAVSRAVEAAVGGHFGLAAENLLRANPLPGFKSGAYELGKAGRQQYADPTAHPTLEPHVKNSLLGGSEYKMKSVLDKNHFEEAKAEWKEGNIVGATARFAKAMFEKTHVPLFEHFVPNLKAAADIMASKMAEAKGLKGDELQRYMSLAHDNVDNNLGMVQGDRQFKNRIVRDIQHLIFLAPGFKEGAVRNFGAAARDLVKGMKDLASGNKASMTPAMYTAMAHLATHAALAYAIQVAYTSATGKTILPSSVADLMKPRTGRKDDQGRDERLTMPTMVSVLNSLLSKTGSSVTASLNPVVKTGMDLAANVDENNVEIAHPGDSRLKQMMDRAKYVGKGTGPFIAESWMKDNRPGVPNGVAKKVAETVGFHTSYTTNSKAEQAGRDILSAQAREHPTTQEQYERRQTRGELTSEFRHHDPNARFHMQQALKEGKLAPSDTREVMAGQKAPVGLAGVLKSLDARDAVSLWDKMTPDERKQNRLLLQGKIGRATSLTQEEKQQLWKALK